MNRSIWSFLRRVSVVAVLAFASVHGPVRAVDVKLEVTIFKASSTWHGHADSAVVMDVHHDNTHVASASAQSNGAGRALLRLRRIGTNQPYSLLPGDHVTVLEGGAAAYDEIIPTWGFDLDLSNKSVAGIVAPNIPVKIDLVTSDMVTVLESTTSQSDPIGRVTANFAEMTQDSLLRMTIDGETTRFLFLAMPLSATFDIAQGLIAGWATPGSTVLLSDDHGLLDAQDNLRTAFASTSPPYGGEWSVPSSRIAALPPGAKLIIDRTGPTGTNERVELIIPPLAVTFRWSNRLIEGNGPPVTAIVIQVGVGANMRASIETVTDDKGYFSTELLSDVPIEAGWWIRALHTMRPGFVMRAHADWLSIHLDMFGTTVKGITKVPNATVTCRLFDTARNLKRSVNTQSDSARSFACGFLGPNGTTDLVLDQIEPGDLLEIETNQGDPTLVNVPMLSAIANTEKGEIRGFANSSIAGGIIRVGRWREQRAVYVDAEIQPDGSYIASFEAMGGIAMGDNGSVEVKDTYGNSFSLGWSAVRISVWLGGHEGDWPTSVEGNAPLGRMVEVELLDPTGRRIGTGKGRTDILGSDVIVGGFWRVNLTDIAGLAYDAIAGDRLRVTAGDQIVELTVPPLDARLDVAAKSLTGQTLPNHELMIGYGRSPDRTTSIKITSGTDGSFDISGNALNDVLYNDDVWAQMALDGHSVGRGIPGPGLVVDLDDGRVDGWFPGATRVTGHVARGGRTVCVLDAETGRDATFSAACRDRDGSPIELNAGDTIGVDGGPSRQLGLTVPAFKVRLDSQIGLVIADVDGIDHLVMEPRETVMHDGRQWNPGRIERTINGHENFTIAIPSYERYHAQMRGAGYRFVGSLPGGHMVTRIDFLPLTNVEVNGASVCGPATPRKTVRIVLTNGSTTLGTFVGLASSMGAFSGQLEHSGMPIQAKAGNTLSMEVDGRSIGDFLVPPLNWRVERDLASPIGPSVDRVTGDALPSTVVDALAPVSDCLSFTNQPVEGIAAATVYRNRDQTDKNGVFGFELLPGVTGLGLGLAQLTDEGLRAYRKQLDLQIVAYPEEGLIELNSGAFEQGSVSIVRDGQPVLSTGVSTDARGVVTLAVPEGLRTGDIIESTMATMSDDARLEDLSADFSPGAELIIRTVANGNFHTQFQLRDGRSVTVVGQANDQGIYRLTPVNLSPRSSWGFDDIRAANVVLQIGDNDVEIVRIIVNPGETASPKVLFLPLLVRR